MVTNRTADKGLVVARAIVALMLLAAVVPFGQRA